MLVLEVALAQINQVQQAALTRAGTGAQIAITIMKIRDVVATMIVSFNSVQARLGTAAVADGRVATLRAALAPGPKSIGWPDRPNRLLQSLDLAACQSVTGGTGEDYLCPMTVGPLRARRFGTFSLLVLYRHAKLTGHVVWIGPDAEIADGRKWVIGQIAAGNL